MPTRPEPGTYVIFNAQGNKMCLGLDKNESSAGLVLRKYSPDAAHSLTWRMWPIPGTDMFYLEHVETGELSRFVNTDKKQITVGALDPNSPEYLLVVDDVGSGHCAINNYNQKLVFDCQENGNIDGTHIIGFKWKESKNDNQKWRFVPIDALEHGSTIASVSDPRLRLEFYSTSGISRWSYFDPNRNSWQPLLNHRLIDTFSGVSLVNVTLSVEVIGIVDPHVNVTEKSTGRGILGQHVPDPERWTFAISVTLEPGSSKSYSINVPGPQTNAFFGFHGSDPTFTISRNG